jgi:hypothetical protein
MSTPTRKPRAQPRCAYYLPAVTSEPSTGQSAKLRPANGRSFLLGDVQALVGGFVESIGLPNGDLMLLNEDGKRLKLPLNPQATLLARAVIGADSIVGNVLVCPPSLFR